MLAKTILNYSHSCKVCGNAECLRNERVEDKSCSKDAMKAITS